MGEVALVERLCEARLIEEPLAKDALLGLIKVSRVRGDLDEIKHHLENYLAVYPKSVDEQANLLHIRARRGEFAAVRAALPQLEALYQSQSFDRLTGWRVLDLLQYSLTGQQQRQAIHRLRDRVATLAGSRTNLFDRGMKRLGLGQMSGSGQPKGGPESPRQLKALLACLHLALDDIQAFCSLVETLSNPDRGPAIFRTLHRVRGRLTDARFPDDQAPKIFGLGLSRTATSSLNTALNSLGFHAIHWKNPLTRKIISQTDVPLFDAFTDISIAGDFEYLYSRYPNSKFILTTRDPQRWEMSVRAHYLMTNGCQELEELRAHPSNKETSAPAGRVFWSIYGRHDSWQAAYHAHHQRVRAFFSDKPANRYLELAVTEGQGYDLLCPFLDQPIPDQPFPNENAQIEKRTLGLAAAPDQVPATP